MLSPSERKAQSLRKNIADLRRQLGEERKASASWSRLAGEYAGLAESRRHALKRAGVDDPANARMPVLVEVEPFNQAMANEVAFVLRSRPVPAKLAGDLMTYVRQVMQERTDG